MAPQSVAFVALAAAVWLPPEKDNRGGRETLSQPQLSDISRGEAELGCFPRHSRVSLPMESPFNDMLLTAAFRGVRR